MFDFLPVQCFCSWSLIIVRMGHCALYAFPLFFLIRISTSQNCQCGHLFLMHPLNTKPVYHSILLYSFWKEIFLQTTVFRIESSGEHVPALDLQTLLCILTEKNHEVKVGIDLDQVTLQGSESLGLKMLLLKQDKAYLTSEEIFVEKKSSNSRLNYYFIYSSYVLLIWLNNREKYKCDCGFVGNICLDF